MITLARSLTANPTSSPFHSQNSLRILTATGEKSIWRSFQLSEKKFRYSEQIFPLRERKIFRIFFLVFFSRSRERKSRKIERRKKERKWFLLIRRNLNGKNTFDIWRMFSSALPILFLSQVASSAGRRRKERKEKEEREREKEREGKEKEERNGEERKRKRKEKNRKKSERRERERTLALQMEFQVAITHTRPATTSSRKAASTTFKSRFSTRRRNFDGKQQIFEAVIFFLLLLQASGVFVLLSFFLSFLLLSFFCLSFLFHFFLIFFFPFFFPFSFLSFSFFEFPRGVVHSLLNTPDFTLSRVLLPSSFSFSPPKIFLFLSLSLPLSFFLLSLLLPNLKTTPARGRESNFCLINRHFVGVQKSFSFLSPSRLRLECARQFNYSVRLPTGIFLPR